MISSKPPTMRGNRKLKLKQTGETKVSKPVVATNNPAPAGTNRVSIFETYRSNLPANESGKESKKRADNVFLSAPPIKRSKDKRNGTLLNHNEMPDLLTDAKVNELMIQLSAKQKEIGVLKHEVANKIAQIQKLEDELKKAKMLLSKKKQQDQTSKLNSNAINSKEIVTLRSAIAKKEETIRQLTKKLTESKGNLLTQESKFGAQNQQIQSKMERQLKQKVHMVSQLENEKSELIRNAESEINSLRETICQLENKTSEFANKERAIEYLKAQLNEKDQQIKAVDDQRILAVEEAKRDKHLVAEAQSAAQDAITQKNHLASQMSQTQGIIDSLHMKVRKGADLRRSLHNAIQELKGNIRVFCRVRPALKGEQSIDIDQPLMAFPPDDPEKRKVALTGELTKSVTGLKQSRKAWHFDFDRVFYPNEGQDVVFKEISQLVQSALDGYNVCIFAYGVTGSGKTYTMEGPSGGLNEQSGLVPRSVVQILQNLPEMANQGWEFGIKATFLEIYNEKIRDLLARNPRAVDPNSYKIQHDEANRTTTVQGLSVVPVSSQEQVAQLMERARNNRSVGMTDANDQSSRSHSVFTLHLSGTNKELHQTRTGVLHLVDLAGSERLVRSNAKGDRLEETKNINKSLSCLGDVIFSLSSQKKHVPYRNSKLTYLLKNSLGGDSKTLMFVNVSPNIAGRHETLCSLRFAEKVNSCEIGMAKKRG